MWNGWKTTFSTEHSPFYLQTTYEMFWTFNKLAREVKILKYATLRCSFWLYHRNVVKPWWWLFQTAVHLETSIQPLTSGDMLTPLLLLRAGNHRRLVDGGSELKPPAGEQEELYFFSCCHPNVTFCYKRILLLLKAWPKVCPPVPTLHDNTAFPQQSRSLS